MRVITDGDGRQWVALPVESIGAHLKKAATLAFRPVDDPEAEAVKTTVQFNSREAAEFAIRTMGEFELKRRLTWAKTEAGIA